MAVFGKAGQRTYGKMTVPHLRKLLEDDVEDVAKREPFALRYARPKHIDGVLARFGHGQGVKTGRS